MLRLLTLAFATLLLTLSSSALAQTSESGATTSSSCAESADSAGSTPTLASTTETPSGGTPSSSDSGLTPVSDSGSGGAGAPIPSGGVLSASEVSDSPAAVVAQEPEPTEPGGEPQEPSGEETPGGEAPAEGGGLPRTGLEVLKLALLGLVLLLVGARIRVIVKRRGARTEHPDSGDAQLEHPEEHAPENHAEVDENPGYDTIPGDSEAADTIVVRDERPGFEEGSDPDGGPEHHDRPQRDEWPFPDPNEPAPTGLLPSTAVARRRARAASTVD